jgi:hypothetical protein
MVSKVWSKNMSNIFIKHFCHHPSGRAVSHFPVIRKSLCNFCCYFFSMDVQSWVGTSVQKQVGRKWLLQKLLRGPYKLHTHFCPCLMLKHSLGINKTLFLYHWNFLLGPKDVQRFFHEITTLLNLDLKKKKMLCWEMLATWKIHNNKQLDYHFLISSSTNIPLDKIMFSTAQVDKDDSEGMLKTFHLQAHYL